MGSRGKYSRRGTPSAMTCVCYGLLPCDRAPGMSLHGLPTASKASLPGNCLPASPDYAVSSVVVNSGKTAISVRSVGDAVTEEIIHRSILCQKSPQWATEFV
jgi:hypothetical protein